MSSPKPATGGPYIPIQLTTGAEQRGHEYVNSDEAWHDTVKASTQLASVLPTHTRLRSGEPSYTVWTLISRDYKDFLRFRTDIPFQRLIDDNHGTNDITGTPNLLYKIRPNLNATLRQKLKHTVYVYGSCVLTFICILCMPSDFLLHSSRPSSYIPTMHQALSSY